MMARPFTKRKTASPIQTRRTSTLSIVVYKIHGGGCPFIFAVASVCGGGGVCGEGGCKKSFLLKTAKAAFFISSRL